jgi:CRISPR-associated DxTHG motif protein
MKKAVITILGTIGGKFDKNKQKFIFTENTNKSCYYSTNKVIDIKKEKYINTLPLLIDNFDCDIIPIFTKDAKEIQQDVLKKLEDINNKDYIFKDDYLIDDEQNFENLFSLIHKIIDNPKYDTLIIDVTHGFRHLPLLMLIELMIVHFQDTSKIEKILFAKEDEKPTENNKFVGKYNFIDLKEYLELANISFVLTTFNKNYTVANHIKSKKYENLINALNDFSDDLMALNLNNMFDRNIGKLQRELNKIDNIAIKSQAKKLSEHINNKFKKANKRYLTYYNLSKELFEKKYMLISLSLLNESLRLYIKTTIKKEHKQIVEKIENAYNQDLYRIGDFFVKLERIEDYEKFNRDIITNNEFNKLKQDFPYKVKEKFEIKNETKNLSNYSAKSLLKVIFW